MEVRRMLSLASMHARDRARCSGLKPSAVQFRLVRSYKRWPTDWSFLFGGGGSARRSISRRRQGHCPSISTPREMLKNGSDQDYDRKHSEVAECGSDRNRPNDISGDQEFKPQQNPSSEISAIRGQNSHPISSITSGRANHADAAIATSRTVETPQPRIPWQSSAQRR
jgi:hypothetical protein